MFGSLLLIGGDVYGRKLIFTIGLLIFGLGSLLVGLSTSGNFIITMGAFQGIGSAIVAPTSLALIIDNYNDDKRERAISYYGITTGLGASIRLIIGGIITTYLSWRWGFLINLPISFVLILLTIKFVPNVYAQKYSKLDYLGTILSTIGFLTLVYGIDGNDYKKISFIVAIILLLLFIVQEAIVEKPLMSLKLFNDRQRSSAYIGRFFFAGTMISYFFLVPQALQSGYGFTPLLSAFAFMPETVPQFLFGIVQSKLADKFKNSAILLCGMIITTLGIVLSFILGLSHGYWLSIAIPMMIIGVGQGLVFGPLTSFGVANATKDIAGMASSVVNVFHQIGSSIVLSLIAALTATYKIPMISYHHQMLIMSIVMIIPLLMTIIIRITDRKENRL